ncbi:MAG TPA: HTTM domain-containing protein, partial [Polyangiaceae bacterium]|nr:HTTM domain-containing protein [Polyangiaceae bacterium]
YLAALLAWLLALSPAARHGSFDAWLWCKLRPSGSKRPPQVARVWLYLFRTQVGIVYVGAGLAKLQPDWLLHAQPLRIWLAASAELPVLGRLLAIDGVPLLLSWLGFLFDLTIVGWLSVARTRPYAYAVVLAFHALTRLLFPIGMFPAIMALSALVFFTPGWPRALGPRFGLFPPGAPPFELRPSSPPDRFVVKAGLALAGLYCAVQLLVPLRCLAYGGNVLWHEQGMRFSWRVMVRAKGGSTTFVVENRGEKKIWYVAPAEYLTPLQESEMSSQPDLILQLARHIKRDMDRRGLGPVVVRADSRVSLNGRRGAPFVDPSIDLAALSDSWAPLPWILPAPVGPPPHTRIAR